MYLAVLKSSCDLTFEAIAAPSRCIESTRQKQTNIEGRLKISNQKENRQNMAKSHFKSL